MFSKLLIKKQNPTPEYNCTCCRKTHNGIPALTFNHPFYWDEKKSTINSGENILTSDLCVIDKKEFFIRVILEIPINDTDQTFSWGVWVSLSKENFFRYKKVFGTKKELKEKRYFGWFSNQIPGYPDTLKIKTSVHLQGGKLRPKIVLDHSDPHPLCQEQHNGITMERMHELIENAGITLN
jgi:hypothetical protein